MSFAAVMIISYKLVCLANICGHADHNKLVSLIYYGVVLSYCLEMNFLYKLQTWHKLWCYGTNDSNIGTWFWGCLIYGCFTQHPNVRIGEFRWALYVSIERESQWAILRYTGSGDKEFWGRRVGDHISAARLVSSTLTSITITIFLSAYKAHEKNSDECF